jgi:hypothetical protein
LEELASKEQRPRWIGTIEAVPVARMSQPSRDHVRS